MVGVSLYLIHVYRFNMAAKNNIIASDFDKLQWETKKYIASYARLTLLGIYLKLCTTRFFRKLWKGTRNTHVHELVFFFRIICFDIIRPSDDFVFFSFVIINKLRKWRRFGLDYIIIIIVIMLNVKFYEAITTVFLCVCGTFSTIAEK